MMVRKGTRRVEREAPAGSRTEGGEVIDPFLGIDPQNIEAVMIAEKDLKSIEI